LGRRSRFAILIERGVYHYFGSVADLDALKQSGRTVMAERLARFLARTIRASPVVAPFLNDRVGPVAKAAATHRANHRAQDRDHSRASECQGHNGAQGSTAGGTRTYAFAFDCASRITS
jgi:hypothetical protein